MNCILVGNGTSILDHKKGNMIDSFDRIVRFNSYKLNGFENFCGTRTTDWFNVRNFQKEDFRLGQNYYQYVFHAWAWESEHKMSELISAKIKTRTNKRILEEMWSFIPRSGYRWYSTGAIAAWMMLKEFRKIYLIGFDWWEKEDHHYGDSEIRGNIHCPKDELVFLKKLGDRVEFLK